MPKTKTRKVKAWAVVRLSDLDMADKFFRTPREALQFRNNWLRNFLEKWPTKGKNIDKIFTEFIRKYKVVPVEIIIKD